MKLKLRIHLDQIDSSKTGAVHRLIFTMLSHLFLPSKLSVSIGSLLSKSESFRGITASAPQHSQVCACEIKYYI